MKNTFFKEQQTHRIVIELSKRKLLIKKYVFS